MLFEVAASPLAEDVEFLAVLEGVEILAIASPEIRPRTLGAVLWQVNW